MTTLLDDVMIDDRYSVNQMTDYLDESDIQLTELSLSEFIDLIESSINVFDEILVKYQE